MIRVLIADDEALIRAGFTALVDSAPDLVVVGEAATGAIAVRQCRALKPDVVLMDIRMPVLDGLDATRHLAVEASTARVLIVTTFAEDANVFEALRAGASGFVLKDTPPELLLAAIRTVAQGDSLLSPAVTRRLIDAFVAVPAQRSGPGLDGLTERELDVLRQVAAGRSNAEIADALVLGLPTVKTHVSRLLTKLQLRDRAQLVVLAYESGLIIPGN